MKSVKKLTFFNFIPISTICILTLRVPGGSLNLASSWRKRIFNSNFFSDLKRNLEKKIDQGISTILILYLICCLCILELHWLNYHCVSEGSENHQKRHGSERVKRVQIHRQKVWFEKKKRNWIFLDFWQKWDWRQIPHNFFRIILKTDIID